MPVHLVGISGGRVWHTVRRTSSWDPWDDVFASAGVPAGAPSRVAAGVVQGTLHVCLVTQSGLFHTVRFGNGRWQPWGNAGAVAFPQVLGLDDVDCVGIGSGLHVVVSGFRRSGSLQTLPAVWHAIRTSNPNPAADSWSRTAEITGRYRIISDVACGSTGGSLHVLARVTDVDGSERLMHTIRFPDGSLQPLRDQDVFPLFPATAAVLRSTRPVAAAGIGPALHVVASNGTELFHTIRLDDTAWQDTFGPIRPAVDATFTAPLTLPATASADGNLHIFAISAAPGRVFHTIRVSNPPAWRNPETASSGSFGDVTAGGVPAGAAGAPASVFDDVAAAGA